MPASLAIFLQTGGFVYFRIQGEADRVEDVLVREMTENKVSTGIVGLDQILRGGLPKNRLYVVEGSPGSGKTTMALQFLLEGIRQGETVLYVTLSETAEEPYEVARSHDWSLEGVHL